MKPKFGRRVGFHVLPSVNIAICQIGFDLLANTTPKDVYEQQIKPYLADGYVYTWQDMKANTPPEFWFHTLPHLQTKLHAANLVLREVKELTPFLGLFRVTKQA